MKTKSLPLKENKISQCEICGDPTVNHRKTCSEKCRWELVSKRLKAKYESGELDWLKEKQRDIGTNNLIEYNKSDTGKKKSSEITTNRNIINNPMNSEDSRRKGSETRKEGLASGRIKNHICNPEIAARAGLKRRLQYASGEATHHMKNKDLAKQVSESLKRAYAEGRAQPPNILDGNRYYRGYFIDKKGRSHYYASGWELKRMQFLDSFPNISWKKLCNEYRIPYVDLNGVNRTYFPDFEVKVDNKIIVEEVGTFTQGKQHKIKIAYEYFQGREEIYVSLGGKDLEKRTW